MKTVIRGTAYIIKFGYPLPSDLPTYANGHRILPKRRQSSCYIRFGKSASTELSDVILEVSGTNDSRDNFSRAKGNQQLTK